MEENIAIIAYFSLKFTFGGQPSHAYKRIRPAEQINTSTLRQMLQGRLHRPPLLCLYTIHI